MQEIVFMQWQVTESMDLKVGVVDNHASDFHAGGPGVCLIMDQKLMISYI